MVSTVVDLARFDVALDAGRLVSPRSRERMVTAARSSSGAGRKLAWHSVWWEKAYSAIYLKRPEERLTLILLANSEGLWWGNPLDKAEIEKSPFVAAFLEHFPAPRKR